jgi:hypothetical protein
VHSAICVSARIRREQFFDSPKLSIAIIDIGIDESKGTEDGMAYLPNKNNDKNSPARHRQTDSEIKR